MPCLLKRGVGIVNNTFKEDCMYTFVFWIMGCVGQTCDISAYAVFYMESEKTCETAESAWEASSELHRGICLPGTIQAADKDMFND